MTTTIVGRSCEEDVGAESRARRLHKYSYTNATSLNPKQDARKGSIYQKTNLTVTTSRMMIMMIVISVIYQTLYSLKNGLGNMGRRKPTRCYTVFY